MTDRRAFLTGMAAIPALAMTAQPAAASSRSTWDAAVFNWKAACITQEAYSEIGPLAEANDRYRDDTDKLATRYGSIRRAKANVQGKAAIEAAFARVTAVEDEGRRHYEAADRAAVQLLRTPAPDIDAVRIKIQVTKDHDLHISLESEPWTIITRDLERLGRAV